MASSYSANGIYVSIALLSIAAPVISHFGTKHRIQKKEYIWVLLGAAALLLTAKRAHLLFTMSALIISYFALSEGKVENKFVRFIAIGIVLITTFVIACYFVPALSNTILRFTDNGGDRLSPKYNSKAELEAKCKDNYSSVLVGSDQLWLPGNIAADYYTLNFVPETVCG